MSSTSRRVDVMRYAARDVDPMSWFTGPYVPLVLAALIASYGGGMVIVTWGRTQTPWLQLIALVLCDSACILIQVLTSLRRRFDWQLGATAVFVGGAGLILSALGYTESLVTVELWWAPFAFGLCVAVLSPYLSTGRLLGWGLLALVTVLPLAFLIVDERVPAWGSVSVFLLIASPAIIATGAGAAFAVSVVHRTLPIVANRSSEVVSPAFAADPEDEEAERVVLARFTARAVPFLREIAERGTVSESDRHLAGELARHLRDDLVSRSDLAWLGLRADDTRVVVADPDRRAQSLRAPQRAAIRDLVRAVLDDPSTDATTLLLALRAQPDGSTAVAMTLDTELPEGRRVRHIAPYYFNLRGTMDDVQLKRDGVSFRVPPDETP